MSRAIVALAGNPNSGKTTLFNALTGSSAKVGNYPGITVEKREATMALPGAVPGAVPGNLPGGREALLLDIPGTYSLSARTAEEQIAIAAIAGLNPYEDPDAVIVVVDGTQLPRHLYLALQVLELRLRVVVALNMSDVLRRNRMHVDTEALSRRLGVPVVAISAAKSEGIDALRQALVDVLDREGDEAVSANVLGSLNGQVGAAIRHVAPAIPPGWSRGDESRREALAVWALLSIDEDDELWEVPDALRTAVAEARLQAQEAGHDLDLAVVSERYRWIDEALVDVMAPAPPAWRRMTDALDRVLIHPFFGFWLFLAVMAVVFDALFSWSTPLIDAVDGAVSAFGAALGGLLPEGLLRDFLVDGLVAGVGAVLVFLPQILMLFLFISLLEDSGYMARAAFLMDRVMKAIGLTGRAFVPMLSGFACAIPAIMATRTMERRRDRMLTMMVVPIMTCSARLPIYTLIIAALYPALGEPGGTVLGVFSLQALLMVAMYIFSTVLALAAAAVLGRTLFRGHTAQLLLELPPYRMPRPRSVLRQMWERSRLFVTEAGTVILACTVVLWVLLTFPRDAPLSRDFAAEAAEVSQVAATMGHADEWLDSRLGALVASENAERLASSWGGRLGHLIEPLIAPLGFDWKIGVGLVGAFAAREVFVSTMGVVYGIGDDVNEQTVPLRSRLQAERWPDGRHVYTPLVGLSLMVFFALAAQCMSTLAVVKRETRSYRWPVFLFTYMTVMAWVASFCVYQGGRLLGYA
jgi:ferrous iron transport protein B